MSEKININKIEGFDPKEYARPIQDTNGQDSLYLDVQYRKMWFRLVHPDGKIVQKIHSFDGNLAVVEARIYADKCDSEDNFLSNAFAQRFASTDPDYGNRYLETAATAAVGRALADAGYGLQFCLERDEKPVDSGQRIQPQVQAPHQAQSHTQAQAQSPQQVQAPKSPVQPQPSQPQKLTSQQQYPQYAGMSVQDISQNMSYKEATRYVYRTRNGKSRHEGETLGDIAANDFSNIQWIVEKYSGADTILKAAACIIYNAHMQQAQ